jgi:hypothetical protein
LPWRATFSLLFLTKAQSAQSAVDRQIIDAVEPREYATACTGICRFLTDSGTRESGMNRTTVYGLKSETTHGLIDKLFQRFDEQLWASTRMPKGCQIVDASLANVPKNSNTRDENKQIKKGQTPECRIALN